MQHVLVPIDFSDNTDPILQTVENLATGFDSVIHFLHVIPSVADTTGWDLMREKQDHFANKYADEFKRINQLAVNLKDRGCEADALMLQGPVPEVILYEANRLNAAFVVIGSHGHGAVYQMLIGSVCEGVLRKASCPVIVVPCRKKTDEPLLRKDQAPQVQA